MKAERQRERDGLMREALRCISERGFTRAVEILAPAATLHPRSASIHRLLGLSYLRQGQITEAANALREAIQINPRDYAAGLVELAFEHWKRELGIVSARPLRSAGERDSGTPDPASATCPSPSVEKESTL